MDNQYEHLAKAASALDLATYELLTAGRYGWASELTKIRDAIYKDMGPENVR